VPGYHHEDPPHTSVGFFLCAWLARCDQAAQTLFAREKAYSDAPASKKVFVGFSIVFS
jgi:hypothetical protein